MLSRSFLSVSAASSAVRSIPSGEATSRRHCPPPRNLKLPGTRRPSPYPHHQLLRGWRRPVSTPPTPSRPRTSWDETSQPPSRPSITSGLETSRLHTPHALATPVISPALPLPIPQPVFKTLKGFQTVAGGKAARPPPPVPCPKNSSPLRSRRGLGVAASQSLRKPGVPMNRDARRDHGDERKLTRERHGGAKSTVFHGVALSRGSESRQVLATGPYRHYADCRISPKKGE